MAQFDLVRMLSPVGPDDFDRAWFDRAPLRIGRNDAAYYRSLCSLDALDEFLSVCQPHYAKCFAIDARRKIGTEEFAGPDGRVDPLRLFGLFEEGATVVYREVEDHFPALAALCRSAEAHFHTPFVATIYWAPKGGRCFPIHYDAKDVYALQVAGSKRWRLYEPHREAPLSHEHCWEALPDVGFLEEVCLQSGDLLYCPRGFPHIVEAADEPSLHISLSTFAVTWADLFAQAAADLFARDAAFRAALPPGHATAADGELDDRFALLARRFAEEARAGPALAALRRRFLASRALRADDAREQVRRMRDLDEGSWIARRDDVVWRIEEMADAIGLIGVGKEIRFHPAAHACLLHALERPRVQLRDLPGNLGLDARIDLVRTLALNGFVAVEDRVLN